MQGSGFKLQAKPPVPEGIGGFFVSAMKAGKMLFLSISEANIFRRIT
jgi:hypothetical protein